MVFEVSTQIQNDFCLLQTGCPLNRYCVIVPNYSSFRREKAIKRKAPKNSVPLLAEAVGFEPTDELPRHRISSAARYDHFDTLPRCRACLFYNIGFVLASNLCSRMKEAVLRSAVVGVFGRFARSDGFCRLRTGSGHGREFLYGCATRFRCGNR